MEHGICKVNRKYTLSFNTFLVSSAQNIWDLYSKHIEDLARTRGIVCVENFFVKSDLRLKPLSVERTFS